MTICLEPNQVKELTEAIRWHMTAHSKETLLRKKYPTVYIALLKTAGRKEDGNALYDGTRTPQNMSWYIQSELLPRICHLRKKGKLTIGEKVINDTFTYKGEIDEDGLAFGIGTTSGNGVTITGMHRADNPDGICTY